MTPALSLAFALAGLYGLALSLLILSWHLTPLLVGLFVDHYSLGSHGQIWANWHAVGCAFVGAINLSALFLGFDDTASRAVLACTAGIYGVWSAQNTWLCLASTEPRRFKPMMWLHAALCGLTAALCLWGAVG